VNDTPSIQNDKSVTISLYTGDVTILSGSIKAATNKLRSVIKMLEPWFEAWRIKNNVSKRSIALFSCQHQDTQRMPRDTPPKHTSAHSKSFRTKYYKRLLTPTVTSIDTLHEQGGVDIASSHLTAKTAGF
jgi:hypothetical protein